VTTCLYKKSFLKDLARLPQRQRARVERLVFEEIPALDDIFAALDIRKMKGYEGYYPRGSEPGELANRAA